MADLDTIKVILRGLLISTQRPLSWQDLARDYRNTEGHDCPYGVFGHYNFLTFLQSIPDTVQVLSNGLVRAVSNKETEHIQLLVATQKSSKPKRRGGGRPSYSSYGARSRSSQYRPPPRFKPSYSSYPSHSSYQHQNAAARTSYSTQDEPLPKRTLIPAGESSDSTDDSFYERFHDDDDSIKRKVIPSSQEGSELSNLIDSSTPTNINQTIRNNLRILMKSYPDGIWACVLPEKYEDKFGVSLNWNELGYDSVIQMAHDLLDIMVCKRVQSGDWVLFDASTQKVNESPESQNKPAPTVPEFVKVKIYDIVKKHTSGIRAEQVAQSYQEYYGKSLSSEAPGFDSVESLLLSIQDTVIHVRYIRKECYIYPGKIPSGSVLPSLKVDIDIKRELGLYPEEVLGPGEKFPPPNLPSNLKNGDYLELQVAEIYNPHKFWVMLREGGVKLDKLMDEMQEFYHDHGPKYDMPEATLAEGLCCASIYEGEWHRALIKSVGDTVEVLYVDYGTIAKVPKGELRFIHRDFCILPTQAISASLSGIQPPAGSERFSSEANQAFLRLVVNKPLVGLIQSFDPEIPFLELFLVDTSGENDLHLNDFLVEQNHAEFKPDLLENAEVREENTTRDQKEAKPHEPTKSCFSSADTPIQNNFSQSETASTGLPPPGFSASGSHPQTLPFQYNLPGMAAAGAYGGNLAFNSMMNPAFAAAYSAACMPQMNATFLMQQQLQQQALLLAYYKNLYQQSVAAKASPSDAVTTNPLLPSSFASQQPELSVSSTAKPAPRIEKKTSRAVQSSSCESESSEDFSRRKRKAYVKRKSPSLSNQPGSGVRSTKGTAPDDLFRSSARSCDPSGNEIRRVPTSSRECSSSSDSFESSICQNVAPDLVRNIENLSLSEDKTSTMNFWKVVEIDGGSVHLFNIDGKAFVSTGELARNFTPFSTCDILVRVLKNKEITPPYKKLLRKERLPLFSALDCYSAEMVKSFDLSWNPNGSVVGVFHLSPLFNVPSMLIPLGINISIIKGFQQLRDSFDPHDSYWSC